MRTIALATLYVGSLFAADISGKWKFSVEHDLGGAKSEPKLVLTQTRTKISGTYQGPFGKLPVTGEIRGETFLLTIRPVKDASFVEFRGKVSANKTVTGNVMFSGDYASKFSGVRE